MRLVILLVAVAFAARAEETPRADRIRTLSDQLHKETQLQAEAMLKIAEVLGEKIDRLSIRVDEGVGNDIQIVVDRMSDAIRAMSTVRRESA